MCALQCKGPRVCKMHGSQLNSQLTFHHRKAKLGRLRHIFQEVFQLGRHCCMAVHFASRGEVNCVQLSLVESSRYILQEDLVKAGGEPHNTWRFIGSWTSESDFDEVQHAA